MSHAIERTPLFALREAHAPNFIARIEADGRTIPEYVRDKFDAYLRRGVRMHGVVRAICSRFRSQSPAAFFCQ